jgi:hypothetical protein
VDARIAALHLVSGDHDRAFSDAEALLALDAGDLQPTVRCQVLRLSALAANCRNDLELARRRCDEARDVARSAGARYELAACAIAAEEIGVLDDGERAAADEVFDQLGVLEVARRPW